MEIQKYFEQKKELYDQILLFLETESNEFSDSNYSNIIQYIKTQRIEESREELLRFIGIVVSIVDNHQRQLGFFNKIENILRYIKEEIRNKMTNDEIYGLFESNKRILLFLIKEKIITINEKILNQISSKIEKNGIKYSDYFQPELEKFDEKSINLTYSEFDKKRLEGENDSYLCLLIRQDNVEEFISYINRSKIPVSSTITPSIFETNSKLNICKVTLIEYAAFFGSVEIFQYLYLNNVKVDGSIWEFAIHSKNSILICHHIESNQIYPIDKTYEAILIESIKCHHNDISNYIENNLLKQNDDNKKTTFKERILDISFQAYNYSYLLNNYDQNIAFFYLCKYNYFNFVNILLEIKKEDIESKIIIEIEIFYNEIRNHQIKKYFIDEKYFSSNKVLKKIAIPPSITYIGSNAFLKCSSLTQISIPSSLTYIGDSAFKGCTSLAQISIPSSVILIGKFAFNGCSLLGQISIPSSVNYIESHAFKECSSLIQISIPPSVTIINDLTFFECTSLEEISIPPKVTSIGWLAFKRCLSLKKILIPSSVITIKKGAFEGCTSLAQVIFEAPSSLISIEKNAFKECSSLEQISIPSSVTNIGKNAFDKGIYFNAPGNAISIPMISSKLLAPVPYCFNIIVDNFIVSTFLKAHQNVASLSLGIGYINKASAVHLLGPTFDQALFNVAYLSVGIGQINKASIPFFVKKSIQIVNAIASAIGYQLKINMNTNDQSYEPSTDSNSDFDIEQFFIFY